MSVPKKCPVCETLLKDTGSVREVVYQGQKIKIIVIECQKCGYVNHREVRE